MAYLDQRGMRSNDAVISVLRQRGKTVTAALVERVIDDTLVDLGREVTMAEVVVALCEAEHNPQLPPLYYFAVARLLSATFAR